MRELPKLPERPFSKPRACLKPGDPDWIHQALGHLQFLYNGQSSNLDHLLAELERLVDVKAWTLYPPEHPYGSFDAMIHAALGCTLDEFFAELERRKLTLKAKAVDPDRERGGQTLNTNAEKSSPSHDYSETENEADHGKDSFGNSTDYLLGRLARDHGELLDRVKSGELTPNRAATMAGIRKPERLLTIASRAVRKMTAQEFSDFEEWLNEESQRRRP